jgi:hypothetical protein
VPTAIPVTTPDELTVAIPLADEVQEPPVVGITRVIVLPAHTVDAPVIAPTKGVVFTVITLVADSVPQPFVTE